LKGVYIFDTTLRDGEQTPGVNLNKIEKLEIAKQLEKLGVDVIEVGFPVTSSGDFEAVKLIAQSIKGPVITALARAVKSDIDTAWEAIKYSEKPRIHTFIATSEIHMKYKLNMTREEVLNKAAEMVAYAKGLCRDIEFSPEDATRTDVEFLYSIIETVIDAGVTVINIPDTVGYSTPKEFGGLIAGIKKNVKNIDRAIISVHCHNDLGLAVANSLMAIENGAAQIECAVNGLGERAGNAALEEVVMGLKTRRDCFGATNHIISENIYNTSLLVKRLTGVDVQHNKAIVGANAFAHESGIHQHGVLNFSGTYEIMTPESIGLNRNSIVLGKHSGNHAFRQRIKDLGFENISEEAENKAFKKFKELTDRKKEIYDEDIKALINDELLIFKEGYNLQYFHISSDSKPSAVSRVKLTLEDKSFEGEANGDGPVDALFNAIEKALGMDLCLKDYSLKSITHGRDAMGEVLVRIENQDKIYTGRAVSTDVIEASAKAYVNAINKILEKI
jgi:2-isopropylmalate synthase